MSEPSVRTRAVRAAAKLLVELAGEGAPGEPVEATVSDGEIEVRVTVALAGSAGSSKNGHADSRVAGARPHLTALDRDILDTLADVPQAMGELARALDHDTDSYFRGRVRRLKRLGLLVAEGEGYRLP